MQWNYPPSEVFLTVLAGLAVAVVLALLSMAAQHAAWADFIGGKSPVEVFALLVGPLGAIAAIIGLYLNARIAQRTYRQALGATLLSNLQKGSEMLGSHSEATAATGVALLQELAAQDSFRTVVMTTLEAFVLEHDSDAWNAAPASFSRPDVQDTTSSTQSSLRAIQALSILNFGHGAANYAVNRPYFARWTMPDGTFGALHLRRARLHHMTFVRCAFTRSEFIAEIGDNVVFDSCFLIGTTFTLLDMSRQILLPEQSSALVMFMNAANSDGCTINGIAFDDWQRRSPPAPARDREGNIVPRGDWSPEHSYS